MSRTGVGHEFHRRKFHAWNFLRWNLSSMVGDATHRSSSLWSYPSCSARTGSMRPAHLLGEAIHAAERKARPPPRLGGRVAAGEVRLRLHLQVVYNSMVSPEL